MNPKILRLLRAKELLLIVAHHPEIARVIAAIDAELRLAQLEEMRAAS
jgi:hypothetical protein